MTLHRKAIYLIITLILIQTYQVLAQERTNVLHQTEELGKVHWYRNYDEAIAVAKKEKKDIVVLFQEVPGCATCRNYGHNVLSHPLMVDALENAFIPLVIYNNKNGNDKKILDKFNEPSWNNPVVRIIDTDGNNRVPRVNNDYSALTLCTRLQEALIAKKTAIPNYLNILEQEITTQNAQVVNEAHFKMCYFWTGEKQLGKLDGVLDVESGFINHSEVVKVKYSSSLVSELDPLAYAKKQGFEFIHNAKN